MPHLDLMRPDHAYFFGFAQTDGNHYAGAGQKGRLAIELSERDAAVLHSFVTLFDLYSRVSYRARTTNFGSHRSATWSVCDLAFRRELVELGLPSGHKSMTVAPPSGPFSVRDYVRGLVDGNGSAGFTGTGRPFIGFVTASQPLAEFYCAQVLEAVGARRTANRNTRDAVLQHPGDCRPRGCSGCLAVSRRVLGTGTEAPGRPRRVRLDPTGGHASATGAGARRWTALEDADVFEGSVREAARRLGRSEKSVAIRRGRLRQAMSSKATTVHHGGQSTG